MAYAATMVSNIHEAKTHLSKLIAAAEAGEEVVIARAGKPAVRLVPVEKKEEPVPYDFRIPDQCRGQIWIADDCWDGEITGMEDGRPPLGPAELVSGVRRGQSAYLLDTHVALWWQDGSERLAAPVRGVLSSRSSHLVLSAASLWEIAIKRNLNKLEPDREFFKTVHSGTIELLPIGADHAAAAGALPLHHRDLFDRMLVAQAQLEGLTLVTADGWIDAYDVPVLDAKPGRGGRGKSRG